MMEEEIKKGEGRLKNGMLDESKYFLVKKKAVPEVLLKVVEAKKLLDSNKNLTIQEVAERVGISRSSYYKYKDDIFQLQENAKGRVITFVVELEDKPGLCSMVLNCIAKYRANIMTIHQSIPINGVALLTLSIMILPDTGDISHLYVKNIPPSTMGRFQENYFDNGRK